MIPVPSAVSFFGAAALGAVALGAVAFAAAAAHVLTSGATRPADPADPWRAARHYHRVDRHLRHEPPPFRAFRHLFAKFEPQLLRLGNFAVKAFAGHARGFPGPARVIPLVFGWFVKLLFGSEVYALEEVEAILRNLDRRYEFSVISRGVCPCRKGLGKFSRRLPNATDFQILAHARVYPRVHPDYHPIPLDRALDFIRQFDRLGLVHCAFGVCGLEGSEVAVCNCHASVCFPLRAHVVGLYRLTPGRHVAVVDPSRCDPACRQRDRCVTICQFRARSVGDSGVVEVDGDKCAGCGVCRNPCARGATKLVPRQGELLGRRRRRLFPPELLTPHA
ncbi:MAG: hypothetical protein Kow0069_07070 [Promethearchaeota archaeon]